MMTNPKKFFSLFMVPLTLGMAFSGCSVFSKRETAGEYVDDTTITARVKTRMIKEPALSALDIHVETMRNVVQLSGFVRSKAQAVLAEKIAREVPGVKDVKNDLVAR